MTLRSYLHSNVTRHVRNPRLRLDLEHEGLSFTRKRGQKLIQQVRILKGSILCNMSGSGKFWKTKGCSDSVLISHDPTHPWWCRVFQNSPNLLLQTYILYISQKPYLLHIHTLHSHHFIKLTTLIFLNTQNTTLFTNGTRFVF